MTDVIANAKAKLRELLTWIEQEMHGKVEEDAKAGVSTVVETAKQQGSDLIEQLANDVKNDVNLAQQGMATVAGDVASAGQSASSEQPPAQTTPKSN